MESLLAISRGAPVSAVLLASIMVASAVGLAAAPGWIERSLFRPYWFVRRREFWTPVTSAFVHADIAHLLFNAFTFWAFAFDLERAIGSQRFLALYVIGLLASDLGTWIR